MVRTQSRTAVTIGGCSVPIASFLERVGAEWETVLIEQIWIS